MKNVYLIVCEEEHPDYPTTYRTNLCCFLDEEKAESYYNELTEAYDSVFKKCATLSSGVSFRGIEEDFSSKYLHGDRFKRDMTFDIETTEIKDIE